VRAEPDEDDGAVDEPTDRPKVSMQKKTPAEELQLARDTVMAHIHGAPGSIQPPTVQAAAPLRALSAPLEAKLANRAGAGYAPYGVDHPRGRVWQRVVLPSGSLAALDGVGAGVAAADGHPVLAIGAGVLFVPLAVLAAAATRWGSRDPLRLTTLERREITKASRWESRQLWTGPLAFCQERGLVVAATRAAERIARSPAWRSGRLDEHRVRLDVGNELDQIDEQAFRIASARYEGSTGGLPVEGPGDPVVDQAWEAALTRVAALTCYAESLDGLARQQAVERARLGDPVRDSDLMAGLTMDEIAVEDITALTYFLGAAIWTGNGL
jgi:hypothetical protein